MNNDKLINQLMQHGIDIGAAPGVTYSLIENFKPEHQYFGFKDYLQNEILEPFNLYDLASLTKVVATTTRILQLLGEHKLNLHDQIGEFIANTSYPNLRIENLLLHNSGLQADLNNISNYKNKTEVLLAIKELNPIYNTGTKVIYSDISFIILGKIIEKIDKISLNKSISNSLLKPLKMNSTGFNLTNPVSDFIPTEFDKITKIYIRGIVHDETARKLEGVSGNAGLFSNIEDLDKFACMYLNYGKYKNMEIIPAGMIKELFNFDFQTRTLGWKRWTPTSKKIWHTGFTGTSIAINFENNTAFICLANRICPTRKNQAWNIIRYKAIEDFFEESEVN